MERPIALESTGYSWICPNCNHENYHIYATPVIRCDLCEEQYEASYITISIQDNGDSSMPSEISQTRRTIMLKPSAYQFECPECFQVNTVNSASRIVKCKKCKAELTAGRVYHRKSLDDMKPNK